MIFLILFLLIVIAAVIVSCIRIVPEGTTFVIERLGKFRAVWDSGLHLKTPVIDMVRRKVLMKEQTLDYPPQPVITKDNVSMKVDAVIYYKVFDPHLYTYAVNDATTALELQVSSTLRSIIGEMTLDECLSSREKINEKMRSILDYETDKWGIKINSALIKSLTLPESVKDAMEKQITAERNKRAEILTAEGHKQADILKAEGHKEALILDAEADKQKRILEAEAERTALINKAEGQAEAIRKVHEAEAQGIEMLRNAKADEAVLRMKSLDALTKVADGNATKLIIPSEISGVASIASAVAETLQTAKEKPHRKVSPNDAKLFNADDEPDALVKNEETIQNWKVR